MLSVVYVAQEVTEIENTLGYQFVKENVYI